MEGFDDIEGLEAGGIKCDNPKCDYRDDSVKMSEWESYVNKPCPKCGENLFTESDYEQTRSVLEIIKFVTQLPEDEMVGVANSMGIDINDPALAGLLKLKFDIHDNKIGIDIEKTDE